MTLTVVVAPDAVAPAGAPATWKLYGPAVTEDAILTVNILVAPGVVGVTGLTVNVPQVIPVGRFAHDRVTDWVDPAVNFTVMETGPLLPD